MLKAPGPLAARRRRLQAALEVSSTLSEIAAGDIVECIDDRPSHAASLVMPRWGGLYTVTSIRPADDGFSVRLKELTPSCHLGGPCGCGHCGWDAARFRRIYRPNGDLIAALHSKVCEPV